VRYAAATDDSRPALHGVLLRLAEGRLTAVACDGFRLAIARADVETDAKLQVILPLPTVAAVKRLLTGATATVALATDGDTARLEVGKSAITSRLVTATRYPDYASIVPSGRPTQLTVSRRRLLAALKTMLLLGRECNNIVRLHAEGNLLSLSATASGTGEFGDELTVHRDGPEAHVALNGYYLAETLANTTGDSLILGVGAPNEAIAVWREGDAEPCAVQMPMHVGDYRRISAAEIEREKVPA
jgi:DNA polymerase-3 subunit beta